jgi:hypothetical protein
MAGCAARTHFTGNASRRTPAHDALDLNRTTQWGQTSMTVATARNLQQSVTAPAAKRLMTVRDYGINAGLRLNPEEGHQRPMPAPDPMTSPAGSGDVIPLFSDKVT